MRCLVSFLLVLLFPVFSVFSAENRPTRTEYKNGHFNTEVGYVVNASYDELCQVLDELYVGMQKRPTKDLKWAWAGLGRNAKIDGDLNLKEDGVSYNPETGVYVLRMLVGVVGDKNPMSFDVEGFMKKEHTKKNSLVQLALTKKIKVLNDANFVVVATPVSASSCSLSVSSSISFGWFFNMFFTRNRYVSIMEWRIAGFLKNVKERAESMKNKNVVAPVND